MRMRWIGVALASGAVAMWGGLAHAATPCASLSSAKLDHAAVAAVADAQAGQITACRIELISRPTADSEIRIEVWIPEGAAWNGRYVQLGNGGFAGGIRAGALEVYAAQGYAVAMTDDGHQAIGTDARWAIGHPQKVIDFGWRALKETTETAKALIRGYQGASAKYAYFQGCSDGGREALMEAQRFPDDFDGIVAGAPAYNFSGLLTLAAQDMQALAKPGGYLDADALKTLEAGTLAACGGGRYVTDQAACRFDPASVACKSGQGGPGCLTAAQVATARAIYGGLGKAYPGNAPGQEAEPGSWSLWITGPSADQLSRALIFQFGTGFWGGFVYGDPSYDLLKLDVAGAPSAAAAAAREVNSTDPDLTRFRAHGGKLIHYHGWDDPAIPAAGSVVYYEEVRAKLGAVDPFYRLYMIPGMLHCGGGQGPSNVDWLAAIRAWVEDGKAPEGLVATAGRPGDPPSPDRPSQAICPYPASGEIDGGGATRRVVCVSIEAPPPPPSAS
jgi:hypothetical protein